MRRTVFIARHGERVDYQWAAADKNWQAQAERPWDSPMTDGGILQAKALGRAVERHRKTLKLPPVYKVFTSPLLRCAQTGCAAAVGLDGVSSIEIEPELAEGMCESWYRSWGVAEANGTWGGPPHSRCGTDVDVTTLHTHARLPASACHATASELQQMMNLQNPELVKEISINTKSEIKNSAHTFTWDNFESDELMTARMKALILKLSEIDTKDNSEDDLGPVLLLSHGGPTAHSCKAILGVAPPMKVGYCGLFAYVPPKNKDEKWTAPVFADHAHLDEVPTATKTGRNDGAEQKQLSPDIS